MNVTAYLLIVYLLLIQIYLILLNKSDVSQTEIIRIIEAMGLITNMCIQMSIDLSCKLPNIHD